MPSLRQKVTTYFRQLSFIAEPREGSGTSHGSRSSLMSPRKTDSAGNFIIKYLDGQTEREYLSPGPEIISGHEPHEMPDLTIALYPTGTSTITAACTGPDEGLTGIKRSKLHLSAGSDIDFIDTFQEHDIEIRKSISNHNKFKLNHTNSQKRGSNNTGVSCGSDQNANKTNRSRKNSRSSINAVGIGNSSSNNAIGQKQQNVEIENKNSITTVQTNINTSGKDGNSATDKTDNLIVTSSGLPTTIYVSMISTSNKNSPKTPQKSQIINNSIIKTAANTTSVKALSQQDPLIISDEVTNNANQLDLVSKATLNEKENAVPNINNEELKRTSILTPANEIKENWNNQVLGSCTLEIDAIAGVTNWKMESENAYGISVSLYEHNMLTKEPMGSPIADCYGLVVRGNVCAMAMADGVNWGDGARLAARSTVHGSLDYLDTAIFGFSQDCAATSTKDVFISLLRSLWEGHDCILEVGGALSTLTVAVILPLSGDQYQGKYVVCACNVGDSLGYIYSKKFGVREFTQGSHDITSMRDMRDALGALGPVDGNKPELSNLTLSMTIVDSGDIVFLTSDGISDNFDPVVGKFAEAWSPETKIRSYEQQRQQLAPKRQNRSATGLYSRINNKNNEKISSSINVNHSKSSTQNHQQQLSTVPGSTTTNTPTRPQRTKKSPSPSSSSTAPVNSIPLDKSASLSNVPSRPKYMRSHTVIEPRISKNHKSRIPCSAAGLPLVTGPQRHALTLLRLEDLLSYGINGQLCPCPSARKLCHLLVDFVRMITSARRKTLEQRELFYKLVTGPDGIKREIEMTRIQHRSGRKRIVDSSAFSSLPGKLDHASVVAYTVGSGLQAKEFQETNF